MAEAVNTQQEQEPSEVVLYLTGTRKGKTCRLGTNLRPYIFKDGKMTVRADNTAMIKMMGKFYAAYPKEQAEKIQAEFVESQKVAEAAKAGK